MKPQSIIDPQHHPARNHFNNLLTIVWLFLSAHRAASDHDFHAFLAKMVGAANLQDSMTLPQQNSSTSSSFNPPYKSKQGSKVFKGGHCLSKKELFFHTHSTLSFWSSCWFSTPNGPPYSHIFSPSKADPLKISKVLVCLPPWLIEAVQLELSERVSCCQSACFGHVKPNKLVFLFFCWWCLKLFTCYLGLQFVITCRNHFKTSTASWNH